MTNTPWQDSTDPVALVNFLAQREGWPRRWGVSESAELPRRVGRDERQLRLLAVGCVRQLAVLDDQPSIQTALDTVEEDALRCWRSQAPPLHDLFAAVQPANDLVNETFERAGRDAAFQHDPRSLTLLESLAAVSALASASALDNVLHILDVLLHRLAFPPATLANLVRCVLGSFFRPVAFDPAWLTRDVRLLAQSIWGDRAFDGMPLLADALQESGCTDAELLAHCRGPGPHARGCWVLDAIVYPWTQTT